VSETINCSRKSNDLQHYYLGCKCSVGGLGGIKSVDGVIVLSSIGISRKLSVLVGIYALILL
jgi:hypothetical protein